MTADRTYADLCDLVTDDALWKTKGQLVAALLETRNNAAKALDESLIDLFHLNRTAVVNTFDTSTGRPCCVIVAAGAPAVAAAKQFARTHQENP